ncbi:MAG: hypothetical protein P0116_13450 [Candidatus Nitrosocosmicus sp.]|nr:hypothetical protein [Candidatus Nitrosocosmicus sp.]
MTQLKGFIIIHWFINLASYYINDLIMKCPHCNTAYHSDFKERFISDNTKSNSEIRTRLFYEYCPECEELILGVYKYNKNDFMKSLGKPDDFEQNLKLLKYVS